MPNKDLVWTLNNLILDFEGRILLRLGYFFEGLVRVIGGTENLVFPLLKLN